MAPDITVRCKVQMYGAESGPLTLATAVIAGLGEVVIGSGRDEFQAQLSAARFLDANYPGRIVHWEGGYHGGDTSGVRPTAGYYKD